MWYIIYYGQAPSVNPLPNPNPDNLKPNQTPGLTERALPGETPPKHKHWQNARPCLKMTSSFSSFSKLYFNVSTMLCRRLELQLFSSTWSYVRGIFQFCISGRDIYRSGNWRRVYCHYKNAGRILVPILPAERTRIVNFTPFNRKHNILRSVSYEKTRQGDRGGETNHATPS